MWPLKTRDSRVKDEHCKRRDCLLKFNKSHQIIFSSFWHNNELSHLVPVWQWTAQFIRPPSVCMRCFLRLHNYSPRSNCEWNSMSYELESLFISLSSLFHGNSIAKLLSLEEVLIHNILQHRNYVGNNYDFTIVC